MRPLLVVTAFVATAAALEAQPRLPDVQVGARVRVHAAQGTSEGTVLESAPDSVVIVQAAGDRRTYRAADITRLEQYLGKRKNVTRGMGYGFVAGAVAGAIVGAVGWHPCDAAEIARNPDYCRHTRRESDAVEGAGIMAVVVGIPVGGVVGWFVKTNSWADIPFKPVIAALRRD